MINTIKYSAKVTGKTPNGKTVTITAPPGLVLFQAGPFLDVSITHSLKVQQEMNKKGEEASIIKIRALIDTGASSTVISPRIAENLKLIHTGFRPVTSVHDEKERPVYFGRVLFNWGKGKDMPLVSCEITNHECLIGRDILQHWYLTYNSVEGSVIICD